MKMNDIEICILPGEVILVQFLDGLERTIVLTVEQAKDVGQWIKDASIAAAL